MLACRLLLPLDKVQVSIEELGLDQIAVMIRDRSGKLIEKNDHPFFGEHKLLNGKLDVSQSFFQTITDNKGIRQRRSPACHFR